MPKVYELGHSNVTFTSPQDKVPAIIRNADRMSSLGWELRCIFDAVTEVTVFYQKEVEPQEKVPPPAVPVTLPNVPTHSIIPG